MLYELGEISGEYIFIDGTKIESAANKYTFVWKKAVTKHQAKLFHKIAILVEECEKLYGLRIVHNRQISLHTLKRLRKKLYKIKKRKVSNLCMASENGNHPCKNPWSLWKPVLIS